MSSYQGVHNVAGQEDPVNGYLREDLYDATLTEVGIAQCKELRSSKTIESTTNSQLLVVSPMRRTLQTATTIFHGLLKCPWVAMEFIREQVKSTDLQYYLFHNNVLYYDTIDRQASL